jgi:hypothetical protein
MKPAPSLLERETTMPVKERIEFTIGDPRALMRINAKQYSDTTTAVIREYSTNAYDSHIMAGISDPIEVSLPSSLNPFFEVRDHGVGMNIDTFRNIYTRFGVSDKDENVKTNGQMGIGSKSGVAYTTQFTVTSVKDGIRTIAKVVREPDWTLVMDVLDESLTDEPNGTTIRIPVHNVEEFKTKAAGFFKFWLPGRVEIDGSPNTHYVGQKIADNLYYSKDWNTSYVVMANVAYRIANPAALFRESRLASLNFVAYVDDLADAFGHAPIDFTPSREDLEYSERTKSTLQGVINKFEADLRKSAQSEINKAKTHAEAYTAWAKWKETLHTNLFGDLEFKGEKFQSDYHCVGRKYVINSSSASTTLTKWGVEATPRTVFITGFNIQPTAEVRRKVKAYCDMTWPDATISYYVFTYAESLDSPWVDWSEQMMVDWQDLKKALPKNAVTRVCNPSYRIQGSWDYITCDGQKMEQSVPTDKTLLWVSVHEERSYQVRTILSMLKADDVVVLIVPLNRLNKLQRENPKLESFVKWARARVQTNGASLLSDDAKKVFNIDTIRKSWISRLDMSLVDDPELKDMNSLLARSDDLLRDYNLHQSLANYLRMRYTGSTFVPYESSSEDSGDDLYSKYPLIRAVSAYGPVHEDVYIYLNAKHAATVAEREKEND